MSKFKSSYREIDIDERKLRSGIKNYKKALMVGVHG